MRQPSRTCNVVLAIVAAMVLCIGTAWADVPIGPAKRVPCPGITGNGARYSGPAAAFQCHSAVVDPVGNIVVLRQGRSNAVESAFGWLHAWLDHNVDDHVIERVVSTSYPRSAPRGRVRYSAELRVERRGIIAVWVEVDRSPSSQSPDAEPFGVLTAYCKIPVKADPESKCPDWVNASLLE